MKRFACALVVASALLVSFSYRAQQLSGYPGPEDGYCACCLDDGAGPLFGDAAPPVVPADGLLGEPLAAPVPVAPTAAVAVLPDDLRQDETAVVSPRRFAVDFPEGRGAPESRRIP
jgi:hypothetical protein